LNNQIPQIRESFIKLDSIVEKALESNKPDDILTKAYFLFINSLKDLKGTGSNITAFSEFFYVRYVLKYLEKHLGIKFKIQHPEKRKSVYFIAPINKNKIFLSSDISIKDAGISIRPDIFVGIKKDEKSIYPIAIFEIKLYQGKYSISRLITRFSKLQNNLKQNKSKLGDEELPYFIWLYLRYARYEGQNFDEELLQFGKLIKNSWLLVNEITKWTFDKYENDIKCYKKVNKVPNGSINTILKEIAKKIQNF
ncbi:MAG: hypothetical protein ACTSRH_14595, partial [Promethearchaeota archaeon]